MAVLLWNLIIAAAFVLLAVGALAYVLANLLLAVIDKGAERNFAALTSAHPRKRSQRQPERLRARFTSIVFRKSICSPSNSSYPARPRRISKRAAGKNRLFYRKSSEPLILIRLHSRIPQKIRRTAS